jgi:hypothetical protein
MKIARRAPTLRTFATLILGASLAPTAFAAVDDESVALTGTLRVLVADDVAHRDAKRLYTLETATGRRIEVAFAGTPPSTLGSGMPVRLHGRFDGKRLAVDAKGGIELRAAPAATAEALPAPHKRRALVVLTDITDSNAVTNAVSPTCDGVDDVSAAIMFGTGTSAENVDGAFLDSSFGLEGVGGAGYPGSASDVVRVLVNQPAPFGATCDHYAWAAAADAAATTAGVNLGNYQHRIYVLPPNTNCGWEGLAELACGADCRAWVTTSAAAACGTRGTYAHELGHNRGFMHASTDLDNDLYVDDEHGDTSDFMGGYDDELRQNNAPHKLALGWIDAATVVNATAGGTFTISALELANPAFPQILQLVPASGTPIYVSYRAPLGYDATMPGGAAYLGRTSLHRWTGTYDNTLFLAGLGDNESFGDAGLGLGIRQVAHDAQTATVQVTKVSKPSLSVADVSVVEGHAGATALNFNVVLSAPVPWPVTVYLRTEDGNATAGDDYVAPATPFVVPPNSTTATLAVAVQGDTAIEGNETFELVLLGATGATYTDDRARGTILDDDATLSISDASLTEADSGNKTLTFTVTLSNPVPGTVSFGASTANGTAVSSTDYSARNIQPGNLSIGPGNLSVNFGITTKGDTTVEPTEYFYVNLNNPSGAAIADGQAIGYIINNDGPLIVVTDIAVPEGASGDKTMTFTVKLTKVAPTPVTYSIATTDATATAGSDYDAIDLVDQVIPAGQLARTHNVTIHGDTDVEDTEVLLVNVRQPTGASIWDGQGTGYILNDDGPTLSVPDASVAEGQSGTKVMNVTVLLSEPAAVPVTYSIRTNNIASAIAGSDYEAIDLTDQVIPAGQTSKTHQIVVNGDTTVEANESFNITLGDPVGASLYDRQALGFIYNDDGPVLSVNDGAVNEGLGGVRFVTFTVSLSQPSPIPISYTIATSNLTATAGSDYIAKTLTGETIPAGMLSRTFTVPVNGDAVPEPNETFRVTLSNISAGATLFKFTGTGTITNDD